MSINNSPNIGPYTELKPFRFWCQKVLPLVYDESLSYYELLCKVIDYLNKTMEDVDQVTSDMTEFKAAYDELIGYVNDYFTNLDVQTEINNKLDAMAASGALTTLIAPYIPSLVASWLGENIVQEAGYVLDKTLTVENAAADSKTVGDILLNISEPTKNINTQGAHRKYCNASGVINASSGNYIGMYAKIACEADTDYNFAVYDSEVTTNSSFYVCWYDSGETLIGSRISQTRAANNLDYTFTSPENAAYMYFCMYNSSGISENAKISIFKNETNPATYTPPFDAIDRSTLALVQILNTQAVREQDYVSRDLDTFKSVGFFIAGYSEALTNAPENLAGLRVIVTYGFPGANVYAQVFYNTSSGNIYIRCFRSNQWFNWIWVNERQGIYNESKESQNTDTTYTTSVSLNHGNKDARVKILSYNVARWNNDSATYIPTEKTINVKKLIMDTDADVVCLQEDAEYIDGDSLKNTLSNVFAPLYCYKAGVGGATIYDKKSDDFHTYTLLDDENNTLITVRKTEVEVDNKTLVVYNAHFTVSSPENRLAQLNGFFDQIIDVVNPDYWVLCGDFNTITATDVTNLTTIAANNNCTLANGGFLGWLKTNKTNVAIDNMLCSENVLIREYHVLENWFDSLYSDHYPTYGVLELLDTE